MPRGIPNKKNKSLKRGRKSKEEKLEQQLVDTKIQQENLFSELNNQAEGFKERVDELVKWNRKLSSDIDGLRAVIVVLGKQIETLQTINGDRPRNF